MRQHLRSFALYLVTWLGVIGIFSVMLTWSRVAPNWPTGLLYAGHYNLPMLPLGWGVVWLAPRLLERRLSHATLVIAHVALALTFSLLWHAGFYTWLWLAAGIEVVRAASGNWWGWQLINGMIVYGLIAGFTSAIASARRLRERDVAMARAESLRVRAEMQALRGQLDPHFLFNTLHSLTALVRTDPRQAEDALVQFGALLRRVLDWKRDDTDEVTLAEEISFVDGCLALEQLRLGERLRVERSFSPDALACYVPVFSVQPLVENAIRHAIAPQRAGGVILLSAEVQGGALKITVADRGPGADATQVAAATGTGLSAIRQRLQLRHGDDATLKIDTSPGHGFAVTLTLPAVTEQVLTAVTVP
jgi:sensor histidine kinase YesM